MRYTLAHGLPSLRCKETRSLYAALAANRFNHIRSIAARKLQMLDDAVELRGLRAAPGNRLEHLGGNRAGQYNIRINEQWRVCFNWGVNGPKNVEIVDNHSGEPHDE